MDENKEAKIPEELQRQLDPAGVLWQLEAKMEATKRATRVLAERPEIAAAWAAHDKADADSTVLSLVPVTPDEPIILAVKALTMTDNEAVYLALSEPDGEGVMILRVEVAYVDSSEEKS